MSPTRRRARSPAVLRLGPRASRGGIRALGPSRTARARLLRPHARVELGARWCVGSTSARSLGPSSPHRSRADAAGHDLRLWEGFSAARRMGSDPRLPLADHSKHRTSCGRSGPRLRPASGDASRTVSRPVPPERRPSERSGFRSGDPTVARSVTRAGVSRLGEPLARVHPSWVSSASESTGRTRTWASAPVAFAAARAGACRGQGRGPSVAGWRGRAGARQVRRDRWGRAGTRSGPSGPRAGRQGGPGRRGRCPRSRRRHRSPRGRRCRRPRGPRGRWHPANASALRPPTGAVGREHQSKVSTRSPITAASRPTALLERPPGPRARSRAGSRSQECRLPGSRLETPFLRWDEV